MPGSTATAASATRSNGPVARSPGPAIAARTQAHPGFSASRSNLPNGHSFVTTPSGPHAVAQRGINAPQAYTPLRGTQERSRAGGMRGQIGPSQALRSGGTFVSPVQTALYRQNAPVHAHTNGMLPVAHVRRIAPVR